MRLSVIVAMAENRVIGADGDLPWRLPADLAHFKETTMGHCLIMGRRTFETTGTLPGRTTIVVSRGSPELPPGVLLAPSPDDAVAIAEAEGDDEAFVAGGGEVYRALLPRADRLYVTVVETRAEGDTSFPELAPGEWRLLESRRRPADDRNPYPMRFLVYER